MIKTLSTRDITAIILLSVTALMVGWDVYAAVNSTSDDTISAIMLATAQNHFTLPFTLGAILGHLFWPWNKTLFGKTGMTTLFYLGFPLLLVVAVIDIFINSSWALPLMVPAGYIVGHFIWPQHPSRPGR